MKKITENALLYRVNQLREKMAIYEAPLDPNYQAKPIVPPQDQQTPLGNDINKAVTTPPPKTPPTAPPVTPETPPPPKTPPTAPPVTPETPPKGDDTNYLDNAWNSVKSVANTAYDDLKSGAQYAWDHPAEIAKGMSSALSSDIDGAKKIANAAIDGWKHPNGNTQNGGTQGQQKINSKQPHTNAPHTGGQYNPQIAALQQQLKAKGANLGTSGPKGDGVDGIMGPLTKAAQAKFSGATPAAPSAPVAGQVMPNGSVSSGDAERDERLAQANQVMNMTPAQRHQFDMAAGQKDYAAAHPAAPAANKAPVAGQMQSTGDPAKDAELAKQGNAVVYKEDQDLARIVQLVNW